MEDTPPTDLHMEDVDESFLNEIREYLNDGDNEKRQQKPSTSMMRHQLFTDNSLKTIMENQSE